MLLIPTVSSNKQMEREESSMGGDDFAFYEETIPVGNTVYLSELAKKIEI